MKKKQTKLRRKVSATRAYKLSAASLARLRALPSLGKRRSKSVDAKFSDALQNLPRITNETVAEHREEVLSSARKYIYPLSHSKRRVVIVTVSLLMTVVVGFLAYCTVALYKFQSTSTFMYGVTQVIPFPVAKAGSSWVSYESYLFELRHTMHYYQNEGQPKEDFNDKRYRNHLTQLKRDAMDQVIQDAYVKQLAKEHHVSVSGTQVNNEVTLVRNQNRLGSNDQVFRTVLSEFWGWTIDDFKRELKQQLLAYNVVAALDKGTQDRAKYVLSQLQGGGDFAALAGQYSDETATKNNGGNYGFQIDTNNHDLAPQVMAALVKLKPGQASDIINTGYNLEIDKLLQVDGSKMTVAHIVFRFQPIGTYTKPLAAKNPAHKYIAIK